MLNNIGYVVIVLKRNPVEDKMPEWVEGNLTATIFYDAENVYGTGKAEYYLPVMSDSNWSSNYANYGFWYGRGFVRVKDVQDGSARIALYTDENNIFREFNLKEGETSGLMYFPGFYCRAGLKVKLNKVVAPEKQAKLNVDGNVIWVRKGSRFLNDKCRVVEISAMPDLTGSISISCSGQKINLMLSKGGAEILGGVKSGENYKLGEKVATGNITSEDISGKVKEESGNLYLGYIGNLPEKISKSEENFVLLINLL